MTTISDEQLAEMASEADEYGFLVDDALPLALRELQQRRAAERAQRTWHGCYGEIDDTEGKPTPTREEVEAKLREVWQHGWRCCRKADEAGCIPAGLGVERDDQIADILDTLCGPQP